MRCRSRRSESDVRELWLGTNNAKKRAELERILRPFGLALRTPAELGVPYEPVEDRPDFAGNAHAKAALLARLAHGFALADDSGLCVDALDGRPGVHSARYGGPGLDDRGRLLTLLRELDGVPPPRRTAHFTCSLCLCGPDGSVLAAIERECPGTLLTAPTGDGGFGYDPIFVPSEFAGDPAHTFARLDAATKDRLSHRGQALRALAERLPALLARQG
ncbi:MAG: non-canonical purine NTP pyrophosphatase [Planctomycetes bacterium]|nr:non-canonical purine NTP pyrophosphatase [Planctomycetota bacterium]